MQIKTFTGTSEHEAITLAKRELGDDIMIVEMKRQQAARAGTDRPKYLVTVALDGQIEEESNGNTPIPHRQATSLAPDDLARPVIITPGSVPPAVSLNEQEIAELFMLRRQLRSIKAGMRASGEAPFDAPLDTCYALLIEAGVPDYMAEDLVERTRTELGGGHAGDMTVAIEELKRQISARIAPFDPEPARGRQEVIALIGPSGSGKTSLIVKLASHKQVYRGRRLAIISTDNHRAGANAGLKSLGNILETPIIEVRQMDDIPRALENLASYDVILIDTPGRSPLVRGALPDLQTQLALLDPTETLLVLSVAMGIEELWLFMGLYKSLQPSGLALTKLDETSKPGKILGVSDDPQLPIRYISEGHAIPNSLVFNFGEAVIKRLPLTTVI